MLKDHEKFWAFMALGAAVLGVVLLAVLFPPEKDQVVRILDAALGGLLLAFGSATNALFRIGTPEDQELKSAAAKAIPQAPSPPPAEPIPVRIEQPPSEPVPTAETPAAIDSPLPPFAR